MGEERQANNDRCQQGHKPEELRGEEPCQNNAADKSQYQRRPVEGNNKIGALKGAGLKRAKTRFVAILRAYLVNLGIDRHLWPSSLEFTEIVRSPFNRHGRCIPIPKLTHIREKRIMGYAVHRRRRTTGGKTYSLGKAIDPSIAIVFGELTPG